ncbi:hypothetical protein JTB14_038257 [Gonioctena quinquepunctata]|nr:hypothetical protein JTB14_038257 [Gonioctena quinquepunctata]
MRVNRFFVFLALLVLAEYGYIPGYRLGFYCKDPHISHKYKGEIVSPLVLGVGSLFLPVLALLLTEVSSNRTFGKISYGKAWYYFRECVIGCVLVLTITEIAKVLVGEHRPHFLDVCQPNTATDCIEGTFIDTYNCTNTKYSSYFLVDSSRSFPSGHSSVSWFVGLFSADIRDNSVALLFTKLCRFVVHKIVSELWKEIFRTE